MFFIRCWFKSAETVQQRAMIAYAMRHRSKSMQRDGGCSRWFGMFSFPFCTLWNGAKSVWLTNAIAYLAFGMWSYINRQTRRIVNNLICELLQSSHAFSSHSIHFCVLKNYHQHEIRKHRSTRILLDFFFRKNFGFLSVWNRVQIKGYFSLFYMWFFLCCEFILMCFFLNGFNHIATEFFFQFSLQLAHCIVLRCCCFGCRYRWCWKETRQTWCLRSWIRTPFTIRCSICRRPIRTIWCTLRWSIRSCIPCTNR